jgi:hypothetical protein
MIRVDRRFLAWIVSLGLGCFGVVLAVREVWPGLSLSSGISPGFVAVSVGFPSLGLPLIVLNIVLSVIARRRGGRARRIGSVCLLALGAVAVFTLAVSLTPPAVVQSLNTVFFFVLLTLLGTGASLPVQLLVLAALTFVLIGSPRTQRAAGPTH